MVLAIVKGQVIRYFLCEESDRIGGSNIFFLDGKYYKVNFFHADPAGLPCEIKVNNKIAEVDFTDKKNPIFIRWLDLKPPV